MQSCVAIQLESTGLVGSFVRLSSCSLLTFQTVPSSTSQLLITFVPLCAIRLTPCTQSAGSYIGLQNVARHGYLSERYEIHGITDCPDKHEKTPPLIQTQYPPLRHSVVKDFECRARTKWPRIYVCVEERFWEKVIGVVVTPVCWYSFVLIECRRNGISTLVYASHMPALLDSADFCSWLFSCYMPCLPLFEISKIQPAYLDIYI